MAGVCTDDFDRVGNLKQSSVSFSHCPFSPLRWRHNEHAGVSNHQPHGCLLNHLFRRRWKKTSKIRVTGLCEGNSPGPVNSPHKGPVTRKMFPFDDVIMPSKYMERNQKINAVEPMQVCLAYWNFTATDEPCQTSRASQHGYAFTIVPLKLFIHTQHYPL